MQRPILSIIIPLYNAQEFISICLDSLFDQDISEDNYELIIVNDGSTDNSMNIVEKYALNHQNIIQINQENRGVSSARNVGIEKSKGEYIIFIDADDTIESKVFNMIITELNKCHVEILMLNSFERKNNYKNNKEVYKFPRKFSGNVFSGPDLFKKGYERGSVCGVIFNKQFIKDCALIFNEDLKNCEDTLFMALCFIHAAQLKHVDLDFYKIYSRLGSASRSWDYIKIKDSLRILYYIKKQVENNSYTLSQNAILHKIGYENICYALSNLFSLYRFEKYSDIKAYILKSGLYPINTCDINVSRFKIHVLNFSFDFFSSLILLKQIIIDTKCFISVRLRTFINF